MVEARVRERLAVVAARPWFPHATLFALALALRLAWVESVRRIGFAFNDAIMYHTTAISVSRGDGYVPLTGGPTARWPPGYGTLLAGVYRTFGIAPAWGERLNALIGAITVVVLVLAVERAIDRRTAVVAGTALAVLPGPILWTDVLVAETVYTFMFVVAMLVLVVARPTPRWTLVIGGLVGLAALVRGEALTWVLLPIVMWWRLVPRKALVGHLAVIVAAAAVVMLPWTFRNAVVMDAFVPVATNASQTLWSGHNRDATGAQVYPPNGFEESFAPDLPERELLASKALRNDAVEYALTHPLRELELIPLKLVHLHRGDSYALDWVNAPASGRAPPLSALAAERIGVVADVGFYAVLALAVLGAVSLGRRFWAAPIGRLTAASWVTMLVLYGFVYYGNYRYRLPYAPVLVVVAAAVALRAWDARHHGAATEGVAASAAELSAR